MRDGSKSELYFVSGGFAEVGSQNVRVLADAAQPAKEIDVALSKRKLGEADEKLKLLEVTDPKAEPLRELIRCEKKRIEVAAMK